MKKIAGCFLVVAAVFSPAQIMPAAVTTLTIEADKPGKPVNPDLFGIFFEDLNYDANGGLYAELVQNRSFEYSPADHKDWKAGDTWLPTSVSDPALAVSTVRDSQGGDLILKIVKTDAAPKPLHIALSGAKNLAPSTTKTVLAGNPMAMNNFAAPQPLVPQTSPITVGPFIDYEASPNSLTVIRMKSQTR